jgi:hypothetical protein
LPASRITTSRIGVAGGRCAAAEAVSWVALIPY